MTVNEDIYRTTSGVYGLSDTERAEHAQRAVAAFRRLQPTLSGFARALTKNPHAKVDLDTGSPRTDGKTIFYRPPITLGVEVKHNRNVCEKRDEMKVMLCPACAQREWVLVTIYHEIAHIVFDSFQKTNEIDKRDAIAQAIKETEGPQAAVIAERVRNAPQWMTDSYMGLARLVSPFLPMIVNALEDARVNREMYKVRPGTKVMFEGRNNKLFTEGVEQPDTRQLLKWSEYPLNAQAICGLLVKAEGHNPRNFFCAQVAADLEDAELTMLVNKLDTMRSVSGSYYLSFEVLNRLRELGYCLLPEDPEPEEPEDGEEDEAEQPVPNESENKDADGDVRSPEESGDAEPDRGEPSGDAGPGDDESEAPEEGEGVQADDAGEDSDGADDGSDQSGSGDDSDDADVPDSGESSPGSDSDGEPDHGDQGGDPGDSEEREPGDDDEASSDASGDQRGDSDPDGDDSRGPASEPDEDAEGSSGSGELTEPSSEGTPSSGTSEPTEADGDPADGVPGDIEPTEPDPGTNVTDLPDEEIDTGADKGEGGTEVRKSNDPAQMGQPDDVQQALKVFGEHDEKPQSAEEAANEAAVDVAIVQGMYFEKPSENVLGVNIHRWRDSDRGAAWTHSEVQRLGLTARQAGISTQMDVPESVLGPALLRMRVAFADNARADHLNNLKSGRVHGRVLGKRAWGDDPRIFRKKSIPGKKDYFVCIGIDVSGSTTGLNIQLAKRAAHAQAELCQRAGVSFAIYAHSGRQPRGVGYSGGINLEIYEIKAEHEPWAPETQFRLASLGPDAENLDGHTLEFYRKRCDESPATDKVILYYTDGKMPAANHDEELEILRREIRTCKQKNITLLGVGIRTDSPVRHGLDTVQVDTDEDMVKVVKHLEKRLSVHRS